MNLVDNYRSYSGLMFGDTIYTKNHPSNTITHKFQRYTNDININSQLNVENINVPTTIFAHTFKTLEIENDFEWCWKINNLESIQKNIFNTDCVLYKASQKTLLLSEDLEDAIDALIQKSLNYTDTSNLSRMILLLMSTKYFSFEIAAKYANDMSVTEETLILLSQVSLNPNNVFSSEDDIKFVIEALSLPKAFKEKLLQ